MIRDLLWVSLHFKANVNLKNLILVEFWQEESNAFTVVLWKEPVSQDGSVHSRTSSRKATTWSYARAPPSARDSSKVCLQYCFAPSSESHLMSPHLSAKCLQTTCLSYCSKAGETRHTTGDGLAPPPCGHLSLFSPRSISHCRKPLNCNKSWYCECQ